MGVIPVVISNTVFALGRTGLKEPVLEGFLAEEKHLQRRRGLSEVEARRRDQLV